MTRPGLIYTHTLTIFEGVPDGRRVEKSVGAFVVVEGRGLRRRGLRPAGHCRVAYRRQRRSLGRQHRYANANTDRFDLRDRHADGDSKQNSLADGDTKRVGLANTERSADGRANGSTDGRSDGGPDGGANPGPISCPTTPPSQNCDPSYPTVCIKPPPPDLNCGNIAQKDFTVLPPDPHGFDGNKDGVGCES